MKTCANCGIAIKRRRPRRGDDDTPLSPETAAYNRQVVTLYVLSLLSLLPIAGLVLGPIVTCRAWRFKYRVTNSALTGAISVHLPFWIGLVTSGLSYTGLTLIVLSFLL